MSYGSSRKARSSAAAGAGLVARAQQVQPQLRVGARVIRIDRQSLPRQRHRIVEAVVARCVRAGDAVDGAEPRVDRERRRDVRLEIGRAVLDEGDGRLERARLEARRIDGERARDAPRRPRRCRDRSAPVLPRARARRRATGSASARARRAAAQRADSLRAIVRPRPTYAGAYPRSAWMAARYERDASACWCFSMSRSPHAVCSSASSPAIAAASRNRSLACCTRPSACAARAARPVALAVARRGTLDDGLQDAFGLGAVAPASAAAARARALPDRRGPPAASGVSDATASS